MTALLSKMREYNRDVFKILSKSFILGNTYIIFNHANDFRTSIFDLGVAYRAYPHCYLQITKP